MNCPKCNRFLNASGRIVETPEGMRMIYRCHFCMQDCNGEVLHTKQCESCKDLRCVLVMHRRSHTDWPRLMQTWECMGCKVRTYSMSSFVEVR